jgi:hypothetical protein
MVGWPTEFQTAQGLTVSSRRSGSQNELKEKQGRTVRTRLSLCILKCLLRPWEGKVPWHHAETWKPLLKSTRNWLPYDSAGQLPMFFENYVGWVDLCHLEAAGPVQTLHRIHSHSTAPGFITDERGNGECKPCIFGAERGTWSWILLSWSLLMKHHDVCSTHKWSMFLQVATPCCPFFMDSIQMAAPQSIEHSWEFGLTAISWRSCFSLEYLAREVGLTAMSWKVTSDWSSDQLFLCSPNGPQLLAIWMADIWCHCLASG